MIFSQCKEKKAPPFDDKLFSEGTATATWLKEYSDAVKLVLQKYASEGLIKPNRLSFFCVQNPDHWEVTFRDYYYWVDSSKDVSPKVLISGAVTTLYLNALNLAAKKVANLQVDWNAFDYFIRYNPDGRFYVWAIESIEDVYPKNLTGYAFKIDSAGIREQTIYNPITQNKSGDEITLQCKEDDFPSVMALYYAEHFRLLYKVNLVTKYHRFVFTKTDLSRYDRN